MARWGRLGAVAICFASALMAPATGASGQASRAAPNLRVSQTQAMPGEILWFRGRDRSAAHRLVKLQRRVQSRWHTIAKTQAKGKGGFELRGRVPTGASTARDLRFRVVTAGTEIHGVTAVAGRRSVDIVAQSVEASGVAAVGAGTPMSVPVVVTPARVGRSAWLEVWEAGKWRRLEASTVQLGQSGDSIPPTETPVWPTWYRVTADRWQGAAAASSAPFVTHLGAHVDVVAHRGGAAEAPESTLAAVRHSVAGGVDAIEADVRRTADGQLVILHDDTLTRTTNVADVFPERASRRVSDYTMAEIDRLDAGSWFGPAFAGEGVPTVAEWVAAIGGGTRIELEAKVPKAAASFTSDLVSLLDTNDAAKAALAAGRLTIISADLDWLTKFGEAQPGISLGALFNERPSTLDLQRLSDAVDIIVVPTLGLDDSFVREAHGRGLKVQLYTPNSEAEMRQSITKLPDGILSDVPALLRQVLSPPVPSS